MNVQSNAMPHVAGGEPKSAANHLPAPLIDKRAVAAMAGGMSVRWVDGEMAKGMPHIRLGSRRTRFDAEEVRAWLKAQYGTRRLGPAKSNIGA
jgi:predicted DNA-binding transcriptional regulator AlpA